MLYLIHKYSKIINKVYGLECKLTIGNCDSMVLIKKYKIVISSLIIAIALLLNGCGDSNSTSSYPRSRSDLTLELLKSLAEKNHELTLKKLIRLRELDPTNVFLANLEILERNNAIIVKSQKYIDEEDLPKALASLNEGIKKNGRHKDLMKARANLEVATQVSQILGVFKNPQQASNLKRASVQLKALAKNHIPVQIFIPLAERKLVEARVMDKREYQRGIETLCSYIDTMIDKNDDDINLLFAILEVEDAEHPTLLKFVDHLKVDSDLSIKTYEYDDLFVSDNEDDYDDSDDDGMSEKSDSVEVDDTSTDNSGKNKEGEGNSEKKKGWWNKFEF